MGLDLIPGFGLSEEAVDAAIAAAVVDPFPYAETVSSNLVSAASTTTANAAILIELPARFTPLTIAKIRLYIGTNSGGLNVDAGVYTFDGTTWTFRASSGSTAAGASGTLQTLTMTTPYVWDGRTRCYLAVAPDNATLAIGAAPSSASLTVGAQDNRMVIRGSSFPLASQFSSATGLAGASRPFWLRAAAS